MPMIVANNLNALSSSRWVTNNSRALDSSMQKLSSGYRINNGQDDPSGLVISEQLRAQNAGMKRAMQNTQEANNLMGIAEGALQEMSNMLVRMRQLCLHAANNTTNPAQIDADQAELDSVVRTIDRIARTTHYGSGQFLLNGNKDLGYDSSMNITDSYDMKLINEEMSSIKQIFKRKDYKLNINFSGGDTVSGENGSEAQKGYFEITKNESSATQINYDSNGSTSNYSLTHDQSFTLSGNYGSRLFTFAKDSHIGEIASTVNNVIDSTGIKASLIFDSNISVESAGAASTAATAVRATNDQNIYCRDQDDEMLSSGSIASTTAMSGIDIGKNTDGDGRLYLRMDDDNKYTIFKDEALTMAVAEGKDDDTVITALNDSGLTGFSFNDASNTINAGYKAVIEVDNIMENSTGSFNTSQGISFSNAATDLDTSFTAGGSCVSGIRLGVNTSETGKIYTKITSDGADAVQVFMYKDERMRSEDLVASSQQITLTTGAAANTYEAVQVQGVLLENGATSGLFATLNLSTGAGVLATAGEVTTEIAAENLALRISTSEYGSNQFIKVDQHEGALFTRYDEVEGAELLDAGLSGARWSSYGRDATVSLNGQQLKLSGIQGAVTNLDATATLNFHAGGLGTTTIAAVGYDLGSYESRAGEMNNDTNDAVHALHSTTESLGSWTGGMQLQLGEGDGDQERSILALRDMSALSLGRISVTKAWDADTTLKFNKNLNLNDMLSGGAASLKYNAVVGLRVIDQAINDVANMRAEIGAFQSNLLETNGNNLAVAIEKITKTESYIRDADMAIESTIFSKNQIMLQASTSMLAQANGLQQGVLSLIS